MEEDDEFEYDNKTGRVSFPHALDKEDILGMAALIATTDNEHELEWLDAEERSAFIQMASMWFFLMPLLEEDLLSFTATLPPGLTDEQVEERLDQEHTRLAALFTDGHLPKDFPEGSHLGSLIRSARYFIDGAPDGGRKGSARRKGIERAEAIWCNILHQTLWHAFDVGTCNGVDRYRNGSN